MTKKNRKRNEGQHPGLVKQGAFPTSPPAKVEKVHRASKFPVSTVIPLLLTIADVCALLNVSRSTLLRLEKAGGLPGRIVLGGQVRYHREVIENFLIGESKKVED